MHSFQAGYSAAARLHAVAPKQHVDACIRHWQPVPEQCAVGLLLTASECLQMAMKALAEHKVRLRTKQQEALRLVGRM